MRALRVIPLTLVLLAAACAAPRATTETSSPGASGTAGASATPDFTGKTLNIVTGGTGGVYIVLGAGLADVLSKKMKISASAQQTTASVDNMKFIGQGKADVAFTLADTAFDAVKGNAPFTEKVDAQAIAVIYGNYTHIVVKADSGINTIADLKGKRVSVGAAGSGTDVTWAQTSSAASRAPGIRVNGVLPWYNPSSWETYAPLRKMVRSRRPGSQAPPSSSATRSK